MHGCALRRIVLTWPPLLVVLLAGCDEPASPPLDTGPCPEASSLFDARSAGTITGRVTWVGPQPTAPPFRSPPRPLSGGEGGPVQSWPNPHVPQISPAAAVGNAVVFLRGVPPQRARPWDHAPVRLELGEYQLRVCQGEVKRAFAFVRRGASIELVSKQADFPSLQGRGANFFARTFPEPGLVCPQRLSRPGVVELMSGSGAFWMRGHLFVDDHPYYAATGPDGRFTLEHVPPGDYEMVCWLPNWRIAERELDGDTGLVWRLTFEPPYSLTRPVRQGPRQAQTIDFVLAAP